MTRKTTNAEFETIMAALSGTSLTERCLILVLSIIEHNSGNALGPTYGFISIVQRMAEAMSREQKNRVADVLRDSADKVEMLEASTIN